MTQTVQPKSLTVAALRWFFGGLLVVVSCWFYFSCQMIGIGVHIQPDPLTSILFAGVALLGIVGGYLAIPPEKRSKKYAMLVEGVLGLGAISLLIGLIELGYQTVFRVPSDDARHADPRVLLFQFSYGTLSILAFCVFNKWIRTDKVDEQK